MNPFKFIQPRLNYSFSIKDKKIAFLALFFKTKMESSRINNILDSENIYFFDNARSGLRLILSLLPPNSRIGVQPFTCPTVLEAIDKAKCTAVFVDINNQLVIDPQKLIQQLDQIDALILTHTFGYPADAREIRLILKDKMLIEDCAHAFLTKNEHGLVGKVGDFALFSHGFAKFPSALRGGYILMNNSKFADAFQIQYSSVSKPRFKELLKNLIQSYIVSLANNIVIYSYITSKIKNRRDRKFTYTKQTSKASEIKQGFRTCQAVFENKLEDINEKLFIQQKYGKIIIEALQGNSSFEICQYAEGMNFFMIPVLVKQPNHFISYAKQNGIEIGRHFIQSQNIAPYYGYHKGSCLNYEEIMNKIVTIPSHSDYPKSKIAILVSIIKAYTNE